MSFFRDLTEDEEKEFRQWARDNFTPGDAISSVWHPIIKDECMLMCNEINDNYGKDKEN